MKKALISILGIIALIGLIFTNTAIADGDAEMDVYVEAEGNVDASFDAEAGGDVNYWIDGIEVKGEFISIWEALGEFDDVWDFINVVNNHLGDTNQLAENAYSYAGSAYAYADDNHLRIIENNSIIMLILDELIKFEQNYSEYKDEVHLNFTSVKSRLDEHDVEIDDLEARVTSLEARLDSLESEFNDFTAAVKFGSFALLGGLIIGGLFLANRRHPFKDVMKNGTGIFGSEKPQKSSKNAKSKAKKAKSAKMPKVKRNPDRSPMKFLFSFFHIHK